MAIPVITAVKEEKSWDQAVDVPILQDWRWALGDEQAIARAHLAEISSEEEESSSESEESSS